MRSNRLPTRNSLLAGLCVALALSAGCQVARVSDPLTARLGGSDPDTQMEFVHELATRPLASNDEAAHMLLLFAAGPDATATTQPAQATPASLPTTYEARIAALKARGLYPASFSAPADEAVQRGVVAYALCKALNIRGGVTMRITGVTPRYAVRELVDMELFPVSSPNQTFSGTELIGVIGKAEDYLRGGGGERTPGGLANGR